MSFVVSRFVPWGRLGRLKIPHRSKVSDAQHLEPVQNSEKHFCSREGVAARAVTFEDRNREVVGNGVESIICEPRHRATRKSNRAKMRIEHSMSGIDSRDFVIYEVGIEGSVVRDQHRVFDELKPSWRNLGEEWRLLDHLVRDSG